MVGHDGDPFVGPILGRLSLEEADVEDDPDDVELLAMALHLQVPIWSNDRDFEGLNVDSFTTEGLLRHLRIIE